jgi:hypothetical protein
MDYIRHFLILTAFVLLPRAISAQGLDTTKIEQALGRSGQKIGSVYKVGFPRTDLHVSIRDFSVA